MKVFDGAKMRAIRKEAELTQYDLAPMVGTVSYTHLTLPTSDLV